MAAAVLELATAEEIATWPGVWAAQRTFAGWILTADGRSPEDTVCSARKLFELTGLSVTVTGVVVH